MCADFFDDLDRLRLSAEQTDSKSTTATKVVSKQPPARFKGEFLRGPIPLAWLTVAANLPGKALAVALAIWFESGRRRGSKTIILTTAILDRFAVGRKAKYRALQHLENAGLVVVNRQPRRNPVVTILNYMGVEGQPDVPAATNDALPSKSVNEQNKENNEGFQKCPRNGEDSQHHLQAVGSGRTGTGPAALDCSDGRQCLPVLA